MLEAARQASSAPGRHGINAGPRRPGTNVSIFVDETTKVVIQGISQDVARGLYHGLRSQATTAPRSWAAPTPARR